MYLSIHVSIYLSICPSVCSNVYIYIYIYIYIFIYGYVFACVYNVLIHVFLDTHTHTPTRSRAKHLDFVYLTWANGSVKLQCRQSAARNIFTIGHAVNIGTTSGGSHRWGYPKWIVFEMENRIKLDDLEVPLLSETSIIFSKNTM